VSMPIMPRGPNGANRQESINQFISMSTFVDCAGVE
jgi:hypothetical protein